MLSLAFERGDPVFVTGVIVQEVLQGASSERHATELQRLLGTCQHIEPVFPETYEHASDLFRRCRSKGRSVRGTVDCLIAAIAIEHNMEVLQRDRDFETLRDICGLRLSSNV